MKVLPDLYPSDADAAVANAITLPYGLIGFSHFRRAELLYLPENLPFLWMKLSAPVGAMNFVVIEPGGVIPNYELELFDGDAASLGLADSSQAMILNIVTLRPQAPLEATVNLVGPIVVNRRTRVGRQVVLANNSHYSARYPLVDRTSLACATA
jgi:flagellar assembly factor FliW